MKHENDRSKDNLSRFASLGFDDFRRMAKDPALSRNEKIGFPDAYREGMEPLIFDDIRGKVSPLSREGSVVMDVGPGCGPLADLIVEHCRAMGQRLLLVDSQEMLDHLPNHKHIEKHPGFFPEIPELFDKYAASVDVFICYSVLHYIFVEASFWRFLDRSFTLLNHGGHMLLGDIPNVSKRKRFFSSATGKAFHREFTGEDRDPEVVPFAIQHDVIDDSVVLGILMRARNAGLDAYVLPQSPGLPMANRREDILIVRP